VMCVFCIIGQTNAATKAEAAAAGLL